MLNTIEIPLVLLTLILISPFPPSSGKASRSCDDNTPGWHTPDMFNCTSDQFVTLRKLLGQLETGDVTVTTFVAVESSASMRKAVRTLRRLHGSDVLIAEQLLQRLLRYEIEQSGLNLTHSQDKDFVQNIVSWLRCAFCNQRGCRRY
jgi:hypothetical protein